MERISHWLAWGTVAAIVIFAGLNWGALSAPTAMNLLVTQVDAPVGVILLGMTAVFVALFFVATLYTRIGTLLESRRLLKEVHHARDLADRAEASRLENLHQLMATEFRLLNQRLDSLAAGGVPTVIDSSPEPGDRPKPATLTSMLTGRGRG